MTTEKNITLEYAFDFLETFENISHRDQIALMKLIGAYGRAEYKRGYEAAQSFNERYKL